MQTKQPKFGMSHRLACALKRKRSKIRCKVGGQEVKTQGAERKGTKNQESIGGKTVKTRKEGDRHLQVLGDGGPDI